MDIFTFQWISILVCLFRRLQIDKADVGIFPLSFVPFFFSLEIIIVLAKNTCGEMTLPPPSSAEYNKMEPDIRIWDRIGTIYVICCLDFVLLGSITIHIAMHGKSDTSLDMSSTAYT